MHPVLLRLSTPFGELALYSYSVMVVVAFLASLAFVYFEARRLGENTDRVVDLSFWAFLFGIIGARVLHVAVEWRTFTDHPLDVFKLWKGGLAYYGGYIAAILACVAFIRWHRLPLGKWADLWAPVAMIALGFGRIGCLLNGCCYGRPAGDLPWAITYPPDSLPMALDGIPLHPSPIYESLAAFLLAGLLVFFHRRPHRPGQVVWTMILGYAAIRFVLEYFRADPRGGIAALGLSTSQAIAVPLALLSLVALLRPKR